MAMNDESIFAKAIEIPSETDRISWLDQACAANPDRRLRIDQLLQSHFDPDPFFDTLPSDLTTIAARDMAEELVGSRIGPYQLLRRLGEGGMGVVYEAEQFTPIRRRVALKVIKPGMDTAKVIARLESERQTLAIMEHPNIAKMLDAGTTDTGLPYFVMELVNGIPITEFCDANTLSLRARLTLFTTLCQAVQHAHQKGIIHRDLKPSNVLVELRDGAPSPKVIDFGIAKAIAQHADDRILYTESNQTVGTPLYMSPEQATRSNLDIDTRTDIYSLGVLLYELLCGRPPFDREWMRQADTDEIRRTLKDVNPPRLSVRVAGFDAATATTVSNSRQVEPGRLRQLLRGELEWITLKCLEKERHRRYDTASALANDVRRYLENIPVNASPPSATYRLKKFVIRNRMLVTSATAIAMAIVLGFGFSFWKYLGERDARREMEVQRNVAIENRANLRKYLYAADMNLAMDAARDASIGQMRPILHRHVPQPGEHDDRGFAWCYLNELQTTSELTAQAAQVFRGHSADVYFVTESPDGSLIASASKDHTARVWNSKTGELVHVLTGHTDEVNCAAFSPDGRTIATASDDKSVRVWDVNTGQELWDLHDFQWIVIRVQFSPDGALLIATEAVLATSSVRTEVWDVATRTLKYGLDNQFVLACHPGGDIMATAGADRDIRLIDLNDGTLTLEMPGSATTPSGTFSKDMKHLVTCDHLPTVTVWNVETGRETNRFHCQDSRPRSSALSPDDQFIAVAGDDGIVRIFHLASGTLYRCLHLQKPIWSVAYSATGDHLTAGTADGTIVRYKCPMSGPHVFLGNCDLPVVDIAITATGDRVFTVGDSTHIHCWRLPEGKPEPTITLNATPETNQLRSVHPLADGQRLLVCDDAGWIYVIATSTGRELDRWSTHGDLIDASAMSINGASVATRSGKTIRVWDGKSHQLRQEIDLKYGMPSMCFSPNGETFIFEGLDELSSIKVNASQARPVSLGEKKTSTVCVWSPDGKWFATGHSDRSITIWDAHTQTEVTVLRGHAIAVWSLAFCPDGKTLASGDASGKLKLWDGATWQELFELHGHTGGISCMEFSTDGRTLVTAGATQGGQVEIWAWRAPQPEPLR